MPEFEPTGDLLSDLQNAIDYHNAVEISYVDRKGQSSQRTVAPLEIRDDRFYAWDMDKNGLRLFILASVGSFSVTDQTFDPESFA